MSLTSISLPSDPEAALRELRELSREHPVFVFKKSPICPVSTMAESEFRSWREAHEGTASFAVVDVLAEKPLARGLTAALGIAHASPQALLFRDGELVWHDSHGALTEAGFREVASPSGGSAPR